MTSPADEIRAAAARVRLVADAHPDHQLGLGPIAYMRADMHEHVARALADWLDFEADLLNTAPHTAVQPRTNHAHTLARHINQQEQP